LVGCSHTIKYGLRESDRWTGPKIDAVVYVKPFVDAAPPVTNKVEHVGKEDWRTNYRKGYASTNLSGQATAMIAKHLAYSGLFTGVSSNEVNAKYVLSGTLSDYQTHGSANETAEGIQAASAGFGALGAILGAASTSGMKSEIRTSVVLSDLQLANKSGEAIWNGSVCVTNDVRISFQEANENAIFNQPDKALRDAVNEMIRRLGNSTLTNRTELKP
jgi:hypothetical protein